MDASTGAAAPNPERLARLVLVTCERVVSMMVEKVPTAAHSRIISPAFCAGKCSSMVCWWSTETFQTKDMYVGFTC